MLELLIALLTLAAAVIRLGGMYGPSQKICNIESAKKVCNAAPEKNPAK